MYSSRHSEQQESEHKTIVIIRYATRHASDYYHLVYSRRCTKKKTSYIHGNQQGMWSYLQVELERENISRFRHHLKNWPYFKIGHTSLFVNVSIKQLKRKKKEFCDSRNKYQIMQPKLTWMVIYFLGFFYNWKHSTVVFLLHSMSFVKWILHT